MICSEQILLLRFPNKLLAKKRSNKHDYKSRLLCASQHPKCDLVSSHCLSPLSLKSQSKVCKGHG